MTSLAGYLLSKAIISWFILASYYDEKFLFGTNNLIDVNEATRINQTIFVVVVVVVVVVA